MSADTDTTRPTDTAGGEKLRLGGMALRNGLLVHGPSHWAAAVRRGDGSIAVASGRKPRLEGRIETIPGARGVVRLGEAMLVIPLVKKALPEAKLPFQDATTLGAMAATAGAAHLVRRRLRGAGGEAAVAVLSLAPSLLALRTGDLAAYHGVEHKAIAAYEQDEDDAAGVAKEHDRCGSHLMAPLLTANVAGGALLRKVVDRPAPGARRGAVAGVHRSRRRGLRLERATRRLRRDTPAATPRLRAPARVGHPRADRDAARGG